MLSHTATCGTALPRDDGSGAGRACLSCEVEVASLGAMKLGNDNTLQFSRGAGVSFLRCLWQ
uniref:Uncharacterized protein n=1 Tax=Oryza glumipatula TaxID=40148 RepID=A0A0D9ZYN0_9ORYZ